MEWREDTGCFSKNIRRITQALGGDKMFAFVNMSACLVLIMIHAAVVFSMGQVSQSRFSLEVDIKHNSVDTGIRGPFIFFVGQNGGNL